MNQKQKDINKSLKAYRDNLSISDEDRKTLLSAREEIRSCLQERLSDDNIRAKFLTQGSFKYRTINRPCHIPNQQMDLDDGVYICTLDANKKSAAQWLGDVAGYLASLADRKKWKISNTKPSCVRIILDEDKHVDIPFYHIPDLDNANLSEGVQPTVHPLLTELDEFLASISYRNFKVIDSDNVKMAHRYEGWKNSDPRKIIEWVVLRVEERGRKYIRICRILKGWRDNQWKDKSPISSIMIMAMVEMAMKEAHIFDKSNKQEDEALFEVVDVIIEKILHGDIPDPDPNKHEHLNSKWTEDEKNDCILKFEGLQKALYGDGDNDVYIRKLCEEFGKFFPKDDSFIKSCKPVAAVVATATTPLANSGKPYASSK